MPSIVVTSASSAWTASTVQLLTACPLRWTVHAPQFDVSQPTCVPVSPSLSRRRCTSSRRGSTSRSCCSPLTFSWTRAWAMLDASWKSENLGSSGRYACGCLGTRGCRGGDPSLNRLGVLHRTAAREDATVQQPALGHEGLQ